MKMRLALQIAWMISMLLYLPHITLAKNSMRRQRQQRQAVLNTTNSNDIIGGEIADTIYPYFGQMEIGCGAALIHDDIMVSAAHCGRESDWRPVRQVHMGSLLRDSQGGGITRNAIKYIQHPDYEVRSNDYDIMLIKLNASALFEPGIDPTSKQDKATLTQLSPITLNRNSENPQRGDPLLIMGFGKTSVLVNELAEDFRKATVFADSDTECVAKYSGEVDPEIMFCAGYPGGGIDSCQGDSGGPIVDANGVQVGIVSWGRGCGLAAYPGVYTRISAVIDWIDEEICRNSCFPPATCSSNIIHPCATTPRNALGLLTGPVSVTLTLQADRFPHEIAVALDHVDTESEIFFHDFGGPLLTNESPLLIKTFDNIPAGIYHITLFDRAFDGFCCSYQGDNGSRSGYVELRNAQTGEVLWSTESNYGDRLGVYINVNENGDAIWVADNPDGTSFWPNPETDDPQWPGQLSTSELPGITLNVRYDDYPQETSWTIDRQIKDMYGSGGNIWGTTAAKVGDESVAGKLFSYNQLVDPGLYRLEVTDSQRDGTCCFFGHGWFTVTDKMGVIWKRAGEKFKAKMKAYFWVGSTGEVQVIDDQNREVDGLDFVEGLGYVLVAERSRRSNGASATIDIILTEAELQDQ